MVLYSYFLYVTVKIILFFLGQQAFTVAATPQSRKIIKRRMEKMEKENPMGINDATDIRFVRPFVSLHLEITFI